MMFTASWSWFIPILVAGAVFAGVLGATPPGFEAIAGHLAAPPASDLEQSVPTKHGSPYSFRQARTTSPMLLSALRAGITTAKRSLTAPSRSVRGEQAFNGLLAAPFLRTEFHGWVAEEYPGLANVGISGGELGARHGIAE